MKRLLVIFLYILGMYQFSIAQNTYPWSSSGNVGIGTTTPDQKLVVAGYISSNVASPEGAALLLENPLKTADDAAFRWALYNMTGSYGNSLQFWNYSQNNMMYGPKLSVLDNGNIGIGTTTPSALMTLRKNGASIRIETASDPSSYYGTITANYDAAEPFAISSQGIKLTGVKALVGSTAQAYLSGYYGVAIATGSANPGTSNVRMYITDAGNVGVGTTNPSEKLSVNGKIRAKEVKVEAAPWPDYVFEKGYELTSLDKLEKFINQHKHLPEIPSALEVEKEGISLGEMNARLLKKIEELTLHLIEQNKQSEHWRKEQEEKMQELQKEISLLKSKL